MCVKYKYIRMLSKSLEYNDSNHMYGYAVIHLVDKWSNKNC